MLPSQRQARRSRRHERFAGEQPVEGLGRERDPIGDVRPEATISHLRLPVGLRRRCALTTGDRVLLAAQPAPGLLLLHPPAVLDTLLPDAGERASR